MPRSPSTGGEGKSRIFGPYAILWTGKFTPAGRLYEFLYEVFREAMRSGGRLNDYSALFSKGLRFFQFHSFALEFGRDPSALPIMESESYKQDRWVVEYLS